MPSVLLFFDHKRFVFNVPEGFQRYAAETKLKLNKVRPSHCRLPPGGIAPRIRADSFTAAVAAFG